MSQHPTCPVHMLLKPCPHCEPVTQYKEKVCGDVEQGDLLAVCECGLLRSANRPHGYTKLNREDYWF